MSTPEPTADLTIYEKLKRVRTKEGINLPHPPNLRKTITTNSGEERKLVLRNYQQQMILHLLAMKRFVVGDDTGLGKTVETIGGLCQVWARKPDTKVVVLTKKSVIPQWADELERFTTGVTVLKGVGTPKKRAKAHEEWENSTGPTVLIQGYTSFCNDFTRVQNWKGHILVADEATVFKTPTTRVHKGVQTPFRSGRPRVGSHRNPHQEHPDGGIRDLPCGSPRSGHVQNVRQHLHVVLLHHADAADRQGSSGARDRRIPPRDIARFREIIDPYYLGRPKHSVAKELPS